MIVMKTVCLQTVDVYYCGGCVPLFDQVSAWYLVWQYTIGLQLCTTMDRHSCVLFNDIVLIALKTINSVENNYQLDE